MRLQEEDAESGPANGVPAGPVQALTLLATMAAEVGVFPSAQTAGVWFARFQANNFSLMQPPPSGTAAVAGQEAVVVGGAVCPRLAILNHSCAPNCRLVTVTAPPPAASGTLWLAVVARQDIAEGEELCHSYVDLEGLPSTGERQAALLEKYCFRCECERCKIGEL